MRRENDLGKDNITALVFRLAIPSMLASFVNVLYSIVDRMFIGNISGVGSVALAGVGVCGPIITLISSFAYLAGAGGAPLLAMRLGENDKKGAEKILSNCFLMLLVLSAVLTAFFLTFKRPLLMAFGASENTFLYANEYLTIYTIGTVFAILSVGLNQFIACQGFSTVAMTSVLIGAVMNIILDPIFIFMLDLGVSGAAIATVIAQFASCIFVVLFLLGQRVHIRITFGGYSWRIMKRAMYFGFCPFIIMATEGVIIIVLNGVLQKYGGPGMGDMLVACATIVQSYMFICTMPLGGITLGTQPILSFNYGAKNIERIKKCFRVVLMLALSFTTIMFVLSQVIPKYFVLIFTNDPQLIEMSVNNIRVFTFGVIILALQYVFVDGLTALGVAKVAISLSLFRKGSFVLLTLIFPMFFGATSTFYAEPTVDIVAGITSTIVFMLLINKLLKKREEMPEGESLYS